MPVTPAGQRSPAVLRIPVWALWRKGWRWELWRDCTSPSQRSAQKKEQQVPGERPLARPCAQWCIGNFFLFISEMGRRGKKERA